MKKKALIISLSVLAVAVAAILVFVFTVPCGSCGDRTFWILNNNELTIMGKGTTNDFSSNDVPWSEHTGNITSVTVKDGITGVGKNIFDSLTALKTVYISKSVESIEAFAFSNCENLEAFVVDEENNSFSTDEAGVLFDKEKTMLIHYPAARKNSSYSVPDGVSVISGSAFIYASNIKEITFPDSLKSIENHALEGCTGIKKIILPSGFQSIGTQSFYYCSSLESIIIPGSVKAISTAAFSLCAVLSKIYFVGTSDQWEQLLVEGNNNWSITPTVIFISDYGTCGENAEFVLTRDRELVISGSGSINDFSKGNTPWSDIANRILKVTVENGITGIGEYAFCELSRAESVSVPKSIKNAGAFAFDGFTNDQTINISNTEDFVKDNWSSDWNKNCGAVINYAH